MAGSDLDEKVSRLQKISNSKEKLDVGLKKGTVTFLKSEQEHAQHQIEAIDSQLSQKSTGFLFGLFGKKESTAEVKQAPVIEESKNKQVNSNEVRSSLLDKMNKVQSMGQLDDSEKQVIQENSI